MLRQIQRIDTLVGSGSCTASRRLGPVPREPPCLRTLIIIKHGGSRGWFSSMGVLQEHALPIEKLLKNQKQPRLMCTMDLSQHDCEGLKTKSRKTISQLCCDKSNVILICSCSCTASRLVEQFLSETPCWNPQRFCSRGVLNKRASARSPTHTRNS